MTADRAIRGDRGPGGQLALGLDPATGGLIDSVRPMLPTDGEGPFDDPGYLFEPWWPGIRAVLSVEGGRVQVRGASLGDPAGRFPELAALPLVVRSDGTVLDATLMVLDPEGRPSAALLDRRLVSDDPPDSLAGTAAVVVSDVLVGGGADLGPRPFSERRAILDELLEPTPWCQVGRGFVGEGLRVASVLAPLGFSALSARRLDARLRRGPAGDAWFRVPLVAAPRALPPVLAVVQRLPL